MTVQSGIRAFVWVFGGISILGGIATALIGVDAYTDGGFAGQGQGVFLMVSGLATILLSLFICLLLMNFAKITDVLERIETKLTQGAGSATAASRAGAVPVSTPPGGPAAASTPGTAQGAGPELSAPEAPNQPTAAPVPVIQLDAADTPPQPSAPIPGVEPPSAPPPAAPQPIASPGQKTVQQEGALGAYSYRMYTDQSADLSGPGGIESFANAEAFHQRLRQLGLVT